MKETKVSHMEMIIVVDGHTFTKEIGKHSIYSEEYGVYIPGSEDANDFNKMVICATGWLALQD
jgi:hypothetical protein